MRRGQGLGRMHAHAHEVRSWRNDWMCVACVPVRCDVDCETVLAMHRMIVACVRSEVNSRIRLRLRCKKASALLRLMNPPHESDLSPRAGACHHLNDPLSASRTRRWRRHASLAPASSPLCLASACGYLITSHCRSPAFPRDEHTPVTTHGSPSC